MNRHFNTVATYIPSDDAWPLRDWETWPHNPNMPEGNAYRLMKERLYRAAASSGSRAVLTGSYGDLIHGGGTYWLAESLAGYRLGSAAIILARHIRYRGLGHPSTTSSLSKVVPWLIDAIPGARRVRPRRRPGPPAWLTSYAQDWLARMPPDAWLPSEAKAARRSHYEAMLGTYSTTGITGEIYHSSRTRIDLRDPYHDRRLIEFALAVPAYVMYDGYRSKAIVYRAMNGILPEPVRSERSRGPLGSLYRRGLVEQGRSTLNAILESPDAMWQRYVKPEMLFRELERRPTALSGARSLVPWFCVSMEIWRKKRLAPIKDANENEPSGGIG